MRRGPFWLRSVRRRPAAFVSLLLLSMVSVAIAVLAPVLLRSVQQQTVTDAVASAGTADTAIIASADGIPGHLDKALLVTDDLVSRTSDSRRWSRPIESVESDDAFAWALLATGADDPSVDLTRVRTPLVGVGASCASAPVLAGRCPSRLGEVAVSRTSTSVRAAGQGSGAPHLGVGSRITVTLDSTSTTLTVVGVYDDRSFSGRILTDPAGLTGASGASSEPALVVAEPQFDALKISGSAYSMLTLRGAVRLGDVAPLRADVARVVGGTRRTESATLNGQASTGLIDVFDRVEPQHQAAEIIVAPVSLAAVVLGWFSVVLVVQQIARVRSAEWGLARLRGLRRRRWLGAVFSEPGAALLMGAVLGLGCGALLALVSAEVLVGPSAPVEPWRPVVFAAAGIAVAGSLLGLVLASVRSARLPLAALLRETTEPRQSSRLALIGQSSVVIVTALAVYSLFGQARIAGPQVGLLVPTLVPIVVGIAAVTVAVRVLRATSRRRPRSFGGVVVGRRLGRTPSVLTAAVLVSLGVAGLTFSSQTAVVALRLQDQRAAAATGASTVLTVRTPADVSLLEAVREADPSGLQAMAAEVSTRGTQAGRIVAVDTSRLAAVSSWRSEWAGLDPARLRHRLAPAGGPSFDVRGTSLLLTVSGVQITRGAEPLSTLQLSVVVQADDGLHSVVLGAPRDGVLHSAPGSFPCSSGCRVAWIEVRSLLASAPAFGVEMGITSFATDRQPASASKEWLDPHRWRNRLGQRTDPQVQAQVDFAHVPGNRKLDMTFTDLTGSSIVSAAPRDAPEPLPALVAGHTDIPAFVGVDDAVRGVAPDLTPLLLRVVGRGPALPRILGQGVLVDLELADRVSDSGERVGHDEVWLAPGSHARVVRRLEAAGIRIVSTRRLSDVEAADRREAPPLAALGGLPTGVAGFILAMGALVALRIAGSGGRRGDWRSLLTAGVRPERLRRVLFWETLIPAASGGFLGVASGLVALWLIVGRLPLMEGAGASPPADLTAAVLPLVVTLLGMLLLLVGIAAVGSRVELHRIERTTE